MVEVFLVLEPYFLVLEIRILVEVSEIMVEEIQNLRLILNFDRRYKKFKKNKFWW